MNYLEVQTCFWVVDQGKKSESTTDNQQRGEAAQGEFLQHCNCKEIEQIKKLTTKLVEIEF